MSSSCMLCNTVKIKSGANSGLTGVYVRPEGVSGLADVPIRVCPACNGSGTMPDKLFNDFLLQGFLPTENSCVISPKTYQEAEKINKRYFGIP